MTDNGTTTDPNWMPDATTDPVRAALADKLERQLNDRDAPAITDGEKRKIVSALRTPAPLHSGEPVAASRAVPHLMRAALISKINETVYVDPDTGKLRDVVYCVDQIMTMIKPAAAATTPLAIELDGGVVASEIARFENDKRTSYPDNEVLAALERIRAAALKPERAIAREGVDADALWVLASALHSNVPEDKRPMSWSDFSPEQIERLQKAANAFLAALSPVALHDGVE